MAKAATSGANLGFEAKLFLTADKLRGSMDASEYKHVALGLIFLKYISDALPALRAFEGGYVWHEGDLAERTFWVPKDARWSREISSVGVSGDCLGGPEILSYAMPLVCSIDADIV